MELICVIIIKSNSNSRGIENQQKCILVNQSVTNKLIFTFQLMNL